MGVRVNGVEVNFPCARYSRKYTLTPDPQDLLNQAIKALNMVAAELPKLSGV